MRTAAAAPQAAVDPTEEMCMQEGARWAALADVGACSALAVSTSRPRATSRAAPLRLTRRLAPCEPSRQDSAPLASHGPAAVRDGAALVRPWHGILPQRANEMWVAPPSVDGAAGRRQTRRGNVCGKAAALPAMLSDDNAASTTLWAC